MLNERPILGPALLLSATLHAGLLCIGLQPMTVRLPKPEPGELTVRLPERSAVPETAVPRLVLPPEPQPNAIAAKPIASLQPKPAAQGPRVALPADSPQRLTGEAALEATEQLARELPYPPEAIERELQGEAVVLLFLDNSGSVIAARLETSSGHAILDEAALRAARQLRALPDSAPREALLPVRFRLR